MACLIFALLTLVVVIHNQRHFHPLEPVPAAAEVPSVSVLIPARNEAERIEPCLQSVLRQQGVEFRVWVLDDRSTDGTGAIVGAYAARDPRVQLHTGEPLPSGWLGKPWACQQLSAHSTEGYLLFLDADVEMAPKTLARAVAQAQRNRLGLLSLLPVQVMGSLTEQILIPILPWSVLSLLPLGWAKRLRPPVFSAAVGQFMLFNREAYQAIGGHQSVRHSVTEDLLLARRMKAAGFSWALGSGRGAVRCRMYPGGRQAIAGLSRSLLGVFDGRKGLHLALWSWIFMVNLLPMVVLGAGLAGAVLPVRIYGQAAAALVVNLAGWLMVRRMAGLSLVAAVGYPLTFALSWAVALRSAWASDRLGAGWRAAAAPEANAP